MVDIGEKCSDNAQKTQKSALFIRPGSAPISPIYSPGHGNNPRYPNFAKISRVIGSGCQPKRKLKKPWIFKSEHLKVTLRQNKLFSFTGYSSFVSIFFGES